ncbi:MAG: MiaB/RimO family radical SAM methylthiotransferase [Acidobacteria bacterium]|nr:MiaB/RimO family radical SAM methylthiotransferase [Acidobacteriota bacterium]
MKYSVITFGCRVNQSDSLRVEEELLASGAQPAAAEVADLVVVNTCSVTASADQGARQMIRRIARTNPGVRIIVTGCYATREREAVASLPNVREVVSNDDKPRLLALMRSSPDGAVDQQWVSSAERYGHGDGSCGAAIEPGLAGRTAFTLRVQTGCAEPCSYCIIPETRGAPRSLPVAQVLAEVARVADAGFREVVLTGVHLGSYGRDLGPRTDLPALLESLRHWADAALDAHGQRVRFRISSLEPMDCTADVVDLVRDADCFAPHFHLPLQHASGGVLAAMRRPYDLAFYRALVDRIRHDLPNASIGSDVIVGFPGEQDADFEELVAYLEQSPLTHVHVFPYSDRPGTVASRMGDRAAGGVVKARGLEIRSVAARLSRRFVAGQQGTVHRALTLEDGRRAVTGNYLKVRIPAGQPRNRWVDVRITATEPDIQGEIVRAY